MQPASSCHTTCLYCPSLLRIQIKIIQIQIRYSGFKDFANLDPDPDQSIKTFQKNRAVNLIKLKQTFEKLKTKNKSSCTNLYAEINFLMQIYCKKWWHSSFAGVTEPFNMSYIPLHLLYAENLLRNSDALSNRNTVLYTIHKKSATPMSFYNLRRQIARS